MSLNAMLMLLQTLMYMFMYAQVVVDPNPDISDSKSLYVVCPRNIVQYVTI